MDKNIFATAINCLDGRTQLPVIEFIQKQYDAEYTDMITEPGPNKILSENKDKTVIESIRRRVAVSIELHKSRLIAIVGHHDCAGNQTGEDSQKQHIRFAINVIKYWNFNVQIIGLWVDEYWRVWEVQ